MANVRIIGGDGDGGAVDHCLIDYSLLVREIVRAYGCNDATMAERRDVG